MYENVTPVQQQAVSNILTSGQKKNYRDEAKLVSGSSEFSHADSPPVDSNSLSVDSTHSDSLPVDSTHSDSSPGDYGAALMPVNLPGRCVDPYVHTSRLMLASKGHFVARFKANKCKYSDTFGSAMLQM